MNWNINKEDQQHIRAIVRRVRTVTLKHGHALTPDRQIELGMDLTACHLNGCPLDLAKLKDAPESDLIHDVCGIHDHIDRETGELRDCFLPRCAVPAKERQVTA